MNNEFTNYNYRFTMTDGETLDFTGFLVFTQSAYAIGTGDQGDILFSTPISSVKHVVRLADLKGAN